MAQPNKWWSRGGSGGGPTLYEILSITPKHLEGQPASAQAKAVKKAYHRALLRHHPDKAGGGGASNNNNNNSGAAVAKSPPAGKSHPSPSSSAAAMYTVDQIQEAYAVLSDGRRRAEYDRSLLLRSSSPSTSRTASGGGQAGKSASTATATATASFRTGVETVDLDALGFDERGGGVYYRACRCGNPRGYRFVDADLEAFEDDGVLMVECLDCSLWLRVLFAPAGDGDGDEENGDGAKREEEAVAKQQQQNREVTGGGGGGGKGWKFNWSFSLGVSVGASASASASRSGS
ncbi:hypothetical protein DL767_009180 [Monosporascus sp. MG133]|nr:hypothetical protein DL767_009180 [Monosporascus sp. MG133]